MTKRKLIGFLLAVGSFAFAQSRSAPVPPPSDPTPEVDAASSGSRAKAAWDILDTGLRDGDVDHRKKALAALGTIGPAPRGVRMVEGVLKDKDVLVRQAAASTLGQMGSPEAIPSLKAALDDGPEVGFTAAKALWDLGDREDSLVFFEEVLEGERKDAPGKLQGAVRDAKKKLRPGELALMGAKEAAGMLGPASVGIDAVQEALKESKTGSGAPGRVIVVEAFAKDADPYALTLLEWATQDSSSAVRVAVAKALGERGNRNSIAKLLPLLSDDRHAVRYMAAASIVKLDLRYP